MSDEQLIIPVVSITDPKPYQVIQRTGYHAKQAYANHPGGPCLGEGTLAITGVVARRSKGRLEARTLLLQDAYGAAVDWRVLDVEWEGELFTATFLVPAGGWYRLELRYIDEARGVWSDPVAVDPVGVGEVFIIAGQSYAENCNDSCMQVEDPQGRISALDPISQAWRIAHDPQPTVNAYNDPQECLKGSIWPAAMNHLLPLIRVPIGMVNVAVGATASRQWMPNEPLFEHLRRAGEVVGPFRGLLWQQGESDVIENVPTEVYKSRLQAIKAALEQHWGHSFPWLPAKSTLHPTVYIKPSEEGDIRRAIEELWSTPGFLPGPDTDILAGIGLHRAGEEASGHFTLLGQQQAGLLWCMAIWNLLQEHVA